MDGCRQAIPMLFIQIRPGSPALAAWWSPELLREFGAPVEGYDVVG